MKKIIYLVLITMVLIAIGAVALASNLQKNESVERNQNTLNSNTEPAELISMTDVAKHNTKTDCWTVINNDVYDITSYIPRHPGSEDILAACGVDASKFFSGRLPGPDGRSNDHTSDSQAIQALKTLKIGMLAK